MDVIYVADNPKDIHEVEDYYMRNYYDEIMTQESLLKSWCESERLDEALPHM